MRFLERAVRNLFRSPHYTDDIFLQMDIIGVGSLPIVAMTGFFSGAVMALQMSRALATYGATGQVGQIVAITLVRERRHPRPVRPGLAGRG